MKTTKLSKLFVIQLFCILPFFGYSQQSNGNVVVMTLEECLNYAKENSVTLKQSKLDIADNEADILSAKGAFLPNVSASLGQSVNSNPLTTSGDKSSFSGSYGVDASMALYSGGKNKAAYQQSLIGGDIARYALAEQENSIEMAVTEVFVEILYATEQIEVAQQSLELTTKSLSRGEALLAAGSINRADLAQLESAKANDEYSVVVSQTALSELYIRLKQLLEISHEVTLQVDASKVSDIDINRIIPTVSEVYSVALDNRPEVKLAERYIESSILGEKIAKAAKLPTISLSAGTGVNHNSGSSFTFSSQLRGNYNASAGVTVSIPIFNGNKTKSAIIKSQNSIQSAELSLVQSQKSLYQTIESLHNMAINAKAKYVVSVKQLEATLKSLELTTEQYNLGMKNIIELLTEQDNYRESAQEQLINKYQLILNRALLEYYQTDSIKL